MKDESWKPTYSRWRHGGWYVHNVRYPNGAIGCVSNNYPDRKWRVASFHLYEVTFSSRDDAAKAEYVGVQMMKQAIRERLAELEHATSEAAPAIAAAREALADIAKNGTVPWNREDFA